MGSAVRHLAWRSAPLLVAGIVVALGGAAVAGGAIMIETSSHDAKAPRPTGPSVPGTSQARAPAAVGPSGGTDSITAVQVAPLRRIVPPDLLAISAKGITAAQLTKIKKLRHVRDVITADGGAIRLQSRLANVLGVDPSTFRSWTPPATAANERIWSSLAKNEFVLSTAAQARLRLHPGTSYQMAGATQALVPLGASATLGVPGVDALVSQSTSHVLGLVPNVAAMINAPGANIRTLISHVRAVLGPPSQIIDLDAAAGRLPVDSGVTTTGRPTIWTCTGNPPSGTAPDCPGRSSPRSGRSRAGMAATTVPRRQGRSVQCSSCPRPGGYGAPLGSATRPLTS